MKRKMRDGLNRLKEVKEAGRNLLQQFRNRIIRFFKRGRPRKNFVYPITIPVSGVTAKDITIDPDEGMLIVHTERQIIVEEHNPYQTWKRYSSFGFDGAIVLPDGVKIRSVDAVPTEKGVLVGWPKNLTDKQRRTIAIQ